MVFTQLGFLGHDAGHRQIFSSRRANDSVGLLAGTLLIGMSFSWWLGKHNRHHSHPNQVDADPDIGAGVLAWTPEQAASRGSVGRAFARHQGYLFFPLLLLEGLNLHVASLRAVFARGGRRHLTETALLLAHFAGGLTLLLLVLSPVRAVVFLIVQQGLFGLYLGCSFAPNHKGMPILSGDTHLDYLRRQVLTSRNVRPGWMTDVVLGGLNYQIEHHLFPSMPRPNLRRCRPLVRAFCQLEDRLRGDVVVDLLPTVAAAPARGPAAYGLNTGQALPVVHSPGHPEKVEQFGSDTPLGRPR